MRVFGRQRERWTTTSETDVLADEVGIRMREVSFNILLYSKIGQRQAFMTRLESYAYVPFSLSA